MNLHWVLTGQNIQPISWQQDDITTQSYLLSSPWQCCKDKEDRGRRVERTILISIQFRLDLGPLQSIRVHYSPSESISVHFDPPGSITVHKGLLQTTRVHQGPLQSIRVHCSPSGSTAFHQGPLWSIRDHYSPSGTIRAHWSWPQFRLSFRSHFRRI